MEKEVTPKLSRQDWLAMGIQILIEKGVEAVKIDPLAKFLNVTRGSFYWHFKDRNDLLEAILNEWETRNTRSVIAQVEELDSSPSSKLLSLFEIAAHDDNRFEKAIRIWSDNDSRAAAAIEQVDRQRLDYLQTLFLQLGFSETDAKVRAQIAYSVRLSWFVMAMPSQSTERLTEIRLVHAILAQTHSSETMPKPVT
jgi:AcrR family transcriptional regulator